MSSILWAGPPRRKGAVRLRLAAYSDGFNYEVTLGLPEPRKATAFPTDPEVKEEYVWCGLKRRPGSTYFERTLSGTWVMDQAGKRVSYSGNLKASEPVLAQLREPHLYPELSILGRGLQEWRFYDHFRTDPESPLRRAQPSVRTPILSHDGIDLAAALQTIREDGDADLLFESIQAVFPGNKLWIIRAGCSFHLEMEVPGLERYLHVTEFSDGTLRSLPDPAAITVDRCRADP